MDKCFFCGSTELRDTASHAGGLYMYKCPVCGWVRLRGDTLVLGDYLGSLSGREKRIASICLRNEHERRGANQPKESLTLDQLELMVKQYRELDALEKMDKALEIIDRRSQYIGAQQKVNLSLDFSLFHCSEPKELHSILRYLEQSMLIEASDPPNPHNDLRITSKGYERLRELKRSGKDSRQCFVAMWFTQDMANVYEKAIRPAIEYIEEGQSEPRFKALKIDQKEHTNDINDEIIAEIRRSRFMVCDLTGYRGGVYWEAGFAYGLGLEVIYTCREDWIKPKTETEGDKVKVIQEGIHFDLEHRARIAWKEDGLFDFQDKLSKKIMAVIV